MIKVFIYDGTEYFTVQSVRDAIFKKEHKLFGNPKTAEDWAKLNVTYEERQPAEPSLDTLKSRKLSELSYKFSAAESGAYMMSSLGFPIDANEKANRDISGLLISLDDEPEGTEVDFCDYNNQFHKVNFEGLKALQKEVVSNGQYLYRQKWAYREKINSAEKKEDLEFEIKFEYLNVNES